jgi:hypothetical protein
LLIDRGGLMGVPYYSVFLARSLMAQEKFRLPDKAINEALNTIKPYMESVVCE